MFVKKTQKTVFLTLLVIELEKLSSSTIMEINLQNNII